MKAEIRRIPNVGVFAEVVHKNGIDYITPSGVIFEDNGVREEFHNRYAALYYLRIIELLPSDDYFPALRKGLKKYLQFITGKRLFIRDTDVAFLIAFLKHC